MTKALSHIKSILGYLLLALGILISIPVMLTLFDLMEMAIVSATIIHLMSCAAGTIGFYILTARHPRRMERGDIWWVFCLVASISMPFYGLIIVIAIYAIQRVRGRKPPPVVSDEITVQSAEVFGKPITRTHKLEVLDRLDIEPFVDIFRRGQQELKKSAIKFLGNIRTKSALRTLNRALMDEDVEIRLYAAGVLGLIDDDYAKEIDTRRTKFDKRPNDLHRALSLVEIYMAYSRSGLVDRISQEYYYNESIRILSGFEGFPEANRVMANCYYDLGKYDKAEKHAKLCLDSESENRACYELLCEILFAKRDFRELAHMIDVAGERIPPAIREDVLAFWK